MLAGHPSNWGGHPFTGKNVFGRGVRQPEKQKIMHEEWRVSERKTILRGP